MYSTTSNNASFQLAILDNGFNTNYMVLKALYTSMTVTNLELLDLILGTSQLQEQILILCKYQRQQSSIRMDKVSSSMSWTYQVVQSRSKYTCAIHVYLLFFDHCCTSAHFVRQFATLLPSVAPHCIRSFFSA
jgi:hypothetical protein